MGQVATGIARLCARPDLIGPGRIGLITNYTGVMPDLGSNVAALLAAGVPVRALFGPEHGLRGTAQAGASEPETTDPASGLPVYDTYRRDGPALDELIGASGVDTLLYDLQDIGTRFYTYVWTMFDLMCAAARTGRRFVVADRPNPIGGAVTEGPPLDPGYASFVGRAPIPLRHGLTCGELARHLNTAAVPERAGRPVELAVLELAGWHRRMHAADTGLPWVLPSPNMPTPDTALAYPGTGLFEGTNLSEGRGTTRPFELIGAPWLDDRFGPALRELALPGVGFRDTWFTPTFHKYAGQTVRGVQLHVTDREAFQPVRTALGMLATLRRLYPTGFGWREPTPAGTSSTCCGVATRCAGPWTPVGTRPNCYRHRPRRPAGPVRPCTTTGRPAGDGAGVPGRGRARPARRLAAGAAGRSGRPGDHPLVVNIQ